MRGVIDSTRQMGRDAGFSLWELLITLLLFTLLLSFLYPSLIMIEREKKANRIYSFVLSWADEETERWRRGEGMGLQSKEVEGVVIQKLVEFVEGEEGMERVKMRFEWEVEDRPYLIEMEIERAVSS